MHEQKVSRVIMVAHSFSLSMVITEEECLGSSCVSKHFFSTVPKPGKCSFATLCVIPLHHVYLNQLLSQWLMCRLSFPSQAWKNEAPMTTEENEQSVMHVKIPGLYKSLLEQRKRLSALSQLSCRRRQHLASDVFCHSWSSKRLY